MHSAARVHKSEDAEKAKIAQSWGSLNWLASAEVLGCANQTLGRVIIRKGMHNPRHRHNRCEEVLYLLSGRLRHTVGDESVILDPGDTLLIPAGAFHNAFSVGDTDAEMIVAYPASQRDFELENQSDA